MFAFALNRSLGTTKFSWRLAVRGQVAKMSIDAAIDTCSLPSGYQPEHNQATQSGGSET